MHGFLLILLGCAETNKPETGDIGDESVLTDGDADGYSSEEDCDDSDATINPGSDELCDGYDNNCDGQVDEGVLTTYYADADGDGFGWPEDTLEDCELPDGYIGNGSDCDDSDPNSYPSAEEVCDGLDNDCDGEIDDGLEVVFYEDLDLDGIGSDVTVEECEVREGLSTLTGDCDDESDAVSPLLAEICDGVDNDCNGETDEGTTTTYYQDLDEDGFGNDDASVESCEQPENHVEVGGDCDDLETFANPDMVEICDLLDNDCDGDEDEADATDASLWYADSDGDGYGDPLVSQPACFQPGGYVSDMTDCNDQEILSSPSGTEVCDLIDNDCDGDVDEPDAVDASTWYADSDGDGYGDPAVSQSACAEPAGYVSDMSDCSDSDGTASPEGLEVCDGQDNDCDGTTDEADASDAVLWYVDDDGDGYGEGTVSETSCTQPAGYVSLATDCDDGRALSNPAGEELCNGFDDDCDGDTDEGDAADAQVWYADTDVDGYGDAAAPLPACEQPAGHVLDSTDCDDDRALSSPEGTEVCNGFDDDCSGETDEADATDAPEWYLDSDIDGEGDADNAVVQCDEPAGYVSNDLDCDDDSDAVNSLQTEICDGIDNDCDGETDDGTAAPSVWFFDDDLDGYGDPEVSQESCEQPEDYVLDSSDCDDTTDLFSPDVEEACDGTDNNCDGETDEDCNTETAGESLDVLPKFGGISQNQCFTGPDTGGNESYSFWSSPRIISFEMFCRLGVNGATLSQAEFEVLDSAGAVVHASDTIACPVVNNGQYHGTVHSIELPASDTYTVNTYGAGCNGYAADQYVVDAYMDILD
jgi:large repetitive protein